MNNFTNFRLNIDLQYHKYKYIEALRTWERMSACRYQIKVFGRVQGVGYRYFCSNAVESLNITGWVRNVSDGAVELQIQGLENDLKRLIALLEKGPTFSRVDQIDKVQIPIQPEESSFKIKY
jgi:acylphosphatase